MHACRVILHAYISTSAPLLPYFVTCTYSVFDTNLSHALQGARMVYERESQIVVDYSRLEKKLREVKIVCSSLHSIACTFSMPCGYTFTILVLGILHFLDFEGCCC